MKNQKSINVIEELTALSKINDQSAEKQQFIDYIASSAPRICSYKYEYDAQKTFFQLLLLVCLKKKIHSNEIEYLEKFAAKYHLNPNLTNLSLKYIQKHGYITATIFFHFTDICCN